MFTILLVLGCERSMAWSTCVLVCVATMHVPTAMCPDGSMPTQMVCNCKIITVEEFKALEQVWTESITLVMQFSRNRFRSMKCAFFLAWLFGEMTAGWLGDVLDLLSRFHLLVHTMDNAPMLSKPHFLLVFSPTNSFEINKWTWQQPVNWPVSNIHCVLWCCRLLRPFLC